MANDVHWANLIRHWADRRGIGQQDQLDLWDDIMTVLEAFVKFLETFEKEGHTHTWATSCNDVSYDGKVIHRGSRRQREKTTCTLMMEALYFKNGWTGSTMHAGHDWGPDNPLRQFVKCAIVSIYMYYLIEINCGDKTGVEYALKIMNALEEAARLQQGFAGTMPVNVCLWEGHHHTKIGQKNVNATVKSWLNGNATMWQKIKDLEKKANCTQGNTQHTQGKGVLDEKEIKDKIMEKMKKVQQDVKEQKEGRRNTAKDQVQDRNSLLSPDPAKTQPAPPPGKDSVAANPGTTATPETTPPQGPPGKNPQPPPQDGGPSGTGAGGQGPGQGPGPGHQPPPPPPPPSTSSSESGSACPSSPDETKKPAGTPGAGTEPTQNLEIPEGQASNGQDDSSKTNTTGVDNTHTDTTKVVDPAPVTTGNGSSASGGSKPDPPLADNTAKDDKAHDGHTAASSPTTQPSQESQPPKAPVTSTDPDQHGHTHDTGSSGAAGPTGPGSTGTGSTGTTNPRSSGTGSTGHQPPSPVPSPGRNNVQSTGSNGTNANKDPGLDLDFKPHADGIGGAYGPNAAPIDPHRTVISEHPPKGPGGPDGPDLTADVLTATTPILLFVASVIVA
ncbi:hypothetical protein AK88_01935, partial [Plasmodium fragile]